MAAKKRGKLAGVRSGGKTHDLIDIRLMKALSNKERVQCLSILSEREASPNELAELLNTRLGKVSYHVKALKGFDLIEMVRTEPRRGLWSTSTGQGSAPFCPTTFGQTFPKAYVVASHEKY